MNTYFYAGYGTEAANGGLHHRSIGEAACAAHMAHDAVKHGDRGRFVVKVTGNYFPARVNDRRGTLTAFLLTNTIEAAAGTTLPTWIATEAAARRMAREAAKAAAEAAKAEAAATVAAVEAAATEAATVEAAAAAAETAESDISAEVLDTDGSADLVESGEALEDDEDDETPTERKNRLRRERRRRVAMAISAEKGEAADLPD